MHLKVSSGDFLYVYIATIRPIQYKSAKVRKSTWESILRRQRVATDEAPESTSKITKPLEIAISLET